MYILRKNYKISFYFSKNRFNQTKTYIIMMKEVIKINELEKVV